MTGRINISGMLLTTCLIFGLSILNSMDLITAQNLDKNDLQFDRISSEISSMYTARDTSGLLHQADLFYKQAENIASDSTKRADLYYYSGVCYLLGHKYNDALSNLMIANTIKKRFRIIDERYLKSIYNISVAYNYLGDFGKSVDFMIEFLNSGKEFFGENSHEIVSTYSPLLGALIENKDYYQLRHYTFEILEILKTNSNVLTAEELGSLYQNIGAGYAHIADHTKVKIYLELALEYYNKTNRAMDQNYINLINNLALTYGNLGMIDKEKEFFEKGIALAVSNNSYLSFNLINSYAIELGNSGRTEKGEKLLWDVVKKAKSVYGTDSRFYITILMNYAEFIRDYEKDTEKSIPLFEICIQYLNDHGEDVLLRDPVITGYSLALSQNGESMKALKIIQDLLFMVTDPGKDHDLFENPGLASLKTDRRMLRILRSKHEILQDVYSDLPSPEVLEAVANTSETIIALIDKIRISISEEESRIVLGDRYRDLYLIAINDFELCYNATGEKRFLEKVFEYTERCKVAGLLAATRELNAIQFQIPPDIAAFEKSVQREIGYINSKISLENDKAKPDRALLASLNNEVLKKIQTRDSLVVTFEKDFPGYYAIKYNTTAPEMKDIPSITGRNTNYLNYVVSDSILYIFLVNRRHQKFFTQSIDSAFFLKLREFRLLLSVPSKNDNARTDFIKYQTIGVDLYKFLVEPVEDYLISDNLLISPDNLLSYLPFEVLLTSKYTGKSILYRNLSYLMNDYNISYAYSATFVEELMLRRSENNKDLVAFAPVYYPGINIDSLFITREAQNRYLYDLPYSREEAEYVVSLRKGKLYLDREARESEYKNVAGNYGIIHLAMHTMLNDQIPMNSAMVFALDSDTVEDGLLNTYEVYGIPLKAAMVVLSSCNTGSGILSTGEGILSLARGFLYSGSQSVVMSMWEIDDKSGTDVVKLFYDNLERGKTKSTSLKSARIRYLKKASQLRSHPYYWSSLVIYGDNAPVFSSGRLLIIITAGLLLSAALIFFYIRNRRYS